MKLIESRTEEEIREELLQLNKLLLNSKRYSRIIQILESVVGSIKSTCLLFCFPDQAEDVYCFLVNGKFVISFELNRLNFLEADPVDLSVSDIRSYRRSLKGRTNSLRLIIAEELSKKIT